MDGKSDIPYLNWFVNNFRYQKFKYFGCHFELTRVRRRIKSISDNALDGTALDTKQQVMHSKIASQRRISICILFCSLTKYKPMDTCMVYLRWNPKLYRQYNKIRENRESLFSHLSKQIFGITTKGVFMWQTLIFYLVQTGSTNLSSQTAGWHNIMKSRCESGLLLQTV